MAGPTSDTITDSGYIKAAEVQAKDIRKGGYEDAAVIAALALWQRFAAKTINDMQDEIAQSSIKISEELLDHYKKYWPYEKAFVDEMFSTEKPKENYLATANIFQQFTNQATDYGGTAWIDYMESKCDPVSACMDARWLRLAGASAVDAANFGLRTEEAWTRAKIDRWYSRRKAALSLGRGVLEEMVSFQGAYNIAGATTGEFIGNSINKLGEAAGYAFKGPGMFDSWGSMNKQTTTQEAIMPNVSYQKPAPQPTQVQENIDIFPYSDRLVK